MRVAIFVGGFPLVSETFILRQITGLIDLGHEVDVFAAIRPEEGGPIHPEVHKYDLLSRTTYMDMPLETGYWEMPIWPITGRTWIPGTTRSILNVKRIAQAMPKLAHCLGVAPRLAIQVLNSHEYGYQASSLSTLYRLSALCSRNQRYDVLHAHFGPTGIAFRFARDLWNAPLIVTFHGYDFSSWPRTQEPGVYSRLFSSVDRVTVNSEYARACVEGLGCPHDKLRQLNYGVDVAEFRFRERRPNPDQPVRILSVGRLVEKKGFEQSIRAVARVLEKHPSIRYDIVGDGALRGTLTDLIHELGLEGTVKLHGARDGQYVRQLMDEAHMFVLTSVTAADGDQEGTPVSLMEAQASGLPVLSTQHSGIPEVVVDGQSGFLVPERDIAAIADRLLSLLEHPDAWPEMGLKGRAHIEKYYDIRVLNRRLVSLYEECRLNYHTARS